MTDADEKKKRLEAIRAANRAKQEASGETPAPAPAAPEAPVAAAATTAPAEAITQPALAPGAGGATSDEKKARLEAIRAANRGTAGDAPAAPPAAATTTSAPAATTVTTQPATAAPAAPRPAATPAPAPVAKPALRGPTAAQLATRLLVGAVLGVLICLALATLTHKYVPAAIFGAIFGALSGVLVGSWPPSEPTTGD